MKMSMVLPEDSLFRGDLRKVLDLLYRKYKTEVENNDPMDVALREHSIKNGGAKPYDLGAQIRLLQSELKYYNISYSTCSEILHFLDKSKIIEQTYDTHEKPFAGTHDQAQFSVFMNFDFEDTYTLLLSKLNSDRTTENTVEDTKISLGSDKIIFNDTEASIAVGDRISHLPPQRNEHDLCRIMFNNPVNMPIDWSVTYQEMIGGNDVPDKKFSRTVQDSMYAVNKRIKEDIGTDDELFSWINKSIKRNF